MIAVFIIMALVLIVLPILLGRLSGRSPMEVIFGRRVNDTAFGQGKDGEKEKAGPVQKNSTKQELMTLISDLLSYSRRNHFYCFTPGTLEVNGEVASLSAVIVTRSAVLGFNCFGYGVFTAGSVELKNRSGTQCYTAKEIMSLLGGDQILRDKGTDPQKVGKLLEQQTKKKR